MNFYKSLLVSVVVFIFASCELEPDRRYKKSNKIEYESILITRMDQIIKNYEKTIDLLKEKQDIYDDMLEIYYAVNAIYNQVVKREKKNFQTLEKLRDQIANLTNILENMEIEWPKEIHDRLSSTKEDLELIHKDLENIFQIKAEAFVKGTPISLKKKVKNNLVPKTVQKEFTIPGETPASEPEEAAATEETPASEPKEAAATEETPASEPEEAAATEETPASEPAEAAATEETPAPPAPKKSDATEETQASETHNI